MPSGLPGKILAGFATWILLAGCESGSQSPASDDRAAIDRIRAQIREAELAGDATVFERVAAEDVVVMPPGAQPIVGRAETVSAMQKFFGQFELRIDYTNTGVDLQGEVAIDRGTYTQTVTSKGGGAPQAGKGSYLWVYRRAADGTWRQTHAIWN
jgi:uncharacterized protein (TIGR02246 family)